MEIDLEEKIGFDIEEALKNKRETKKNYTKSPNESQEKCKKRKKRN